MRVRQTMWSLLAAVLAMLALAACGEDGDEEETQTGEFAVVEDAPAGFEDASGTAEITRSDDGTEVSFDVSGLEPNTEFASHLHVGTCDQADPGGPHFKFDLNGSDMPPNEIHLPFTSDAEGNGSAEATSDMRVPDDDGRSVVIHLAAVPHEEAHGGTGQEEHGGTEQGEHGGKQRHSAGKQAPGGAEGEHNGKQHSGGEQASGGAQDSQHGGAGHTHQPKALCANLG